MGRPRSTDQERETRARVLDAAAQAFGSVGYEAARLEDIAAAAGIRRPSLLYHFGSKEELYDAVVSAAFVAMEAAIAPVLASPAPYEARLLHLIDALIAFEAAHLPVLAVLLRGVLRSDPRARRIVETRLVPLVDEMVAFIEGSGGAPSGVPVRAALLHILLGHFLRSALGATGQALFGGEAGSRELARVLLTTPRRPAARAR